MSNSHSKDLQEALLQLGRLKKERPSLQGPADFFADVLPVLFDGASRDSAPSMTPEQAHAKLADGAPLLRGESIPIDRAAVRRRWIGVAAVVERRQDKRAGKALARAVDQEFWDPKFIAAAVSAALVQERAEALGLDGDLVATVVRLSLFPSLATMQQQLRPLWSELAWERGYCPICGGWPLLGEFRGLEQTRFLRCGLCAAEWKAPHLLCPFCETRDHRRLGYLTLEGDEAKYRINTCDACRCYSKTISTLMPLSPPQLLAADVATLHLDLAASERGYGIGGSMEDLGDSE
jgi:FdhE protein